MIESYTYSLTDELTIQDASTMANLVQEHPKMYLELYGEDAVTPKWHYNWFTCQTRYCSKEFCIALLTIIQLFVVTVFP